MWPGAHVALVPVGGECALVAVVVTAHVPEVCVLETIPAVAQGGDVPTLSAKPGGPQQNGLHAGVQGICWRLEKVVEIRNLDRVS